jgi:hypothetical protein
MTEAWTRKEGKNPKGGLNAKGRASYKGGTLKAPVKSGDNPRRASFLARMAGSKGRKGFSSGGTVRLSWRLVPLRRQRVGLLNDHRQRMYCHLCESVTAGLLMGLLGALHGRVGTLYGGNFQALNGRTFDGQPSGLVGARYGALRRRL